MPCCFPRGWHVAPFGLALTAARQNAERVETVGIAPYRLRLVAFVISGAITGLAGALFADLNRFVSPTMFSWHTSGEIMIFVILGGVGRLFGPVAGAALFILLEHLLGGVSDYWQIYPWRAVAGRRAFCAWRLDRDRWRDGRWRMTEPLLQTRGISKSFGALQAVERCQS